MLLTPERVAANQANSKKSSGPRTARGKAASRGNSLKHGLTGAGLALPDEDKAEVDAAFGRHFAQMLPQTQAGLAIVFKLALAELRLVRFAKAEAAVLSQRVIDAGHAFDDAQFARLDEAKANLHRKPQATLATLSRFERGVQWVIEAWEALQCAIASAKLKNWRQPQHELFEALMGRSTEFPSYDDSTFWSLAAKGDEGALDDSDLPGETRAARWQSARDRMAAICKEESARWESMLEAATAATGIARLNAIAAARYDGSKEGLLMKKYEAATNREMTRAAKEFEAVEAAYGIPEPEVEAEPIVETPVPQATCVEVGSFLPEPTSDEPESDDEAPETGANPVQIAQTFPVAGSDRSDPSLASVVAAEDRRS